MRRAGNDRRATATWIPDLHRRSGQGNDTTDFVADLRARDVTPHVAQQIRKYRGSKIDAPTTRHPGYKLGLGSGTDDNHGSERGRISFAESVLRSLLGGIGHGRVTELHHIAGGSRPAGWASMPACRRWRRGWWRVLRRRRRMVVDDGRQRRRRTGNVGSVLRRRACGRRQRRRGGRQRSRHYHSAVTRTAGQPGA